MKINSVLIYNSNFAEENELSAIWLTLTVEIWLTMSSKPTLDRVPNFSLPFIWQFVMIMGKKQEKKKKEEIPTNRSFSMTPSDTLNTIFLSISFSEKVNEAIKYNFAILYLSYTNKLSRRS